MKYSMICCFIILFFAGCDKLNGIDEGDRNTYTWKGTIFEGYSDKPLASQKVYLEVGYIGVGVGKEEVIGETTTDENGFYSITYRKIRKLAEGVALYVESGQYSTSPIKIGKVNVDYYIDLATTTYSSIQMTVESFSKEIDSLIVVPLGLVDASIQRYDERFETKGEGKLLIFELNSIQKQTISIKCVVSALTKDANLNRWGFNYFYGCKDFKLALDADTNHSSDYVIKQYWQDVNIFPDMDSVFFRIEE